MSGLRARRPRAGKPPVKRPVGRPAAFDENMAQMTVLVRKDQAEWVTQYRATQKAANQQAVSEGQVLRWALDAFISLVRGVPVVLPAAAQELPTNGKEQ